MTYTKPEIAVLGNARAVIEHLQNKTTGSVDASGPQKGIPAYDLDE
jgi:hypothetical protein